MKNNLQNLTDEQLLIELAQGNGKALNLLYLRHSGRVLTYAKKRGLSQERAEDLVQIVFMQVHRKKNLYDPKHAALAWIYVITRSELKDYRNRELKDFIDLQENLSQNVDVNPILEAREESQLLLRQLRPREKEVMKLRYLDELEFDEIAERLKESESNVRQMVSRSLRFLRGLGKGR